MICLDKKYRKTRNSNLSNSLKMNQLSLEVAEVNSSAAFDIIGSVKPFDNSLDLVLSAKTVEEFLVAKDILGIKKFNQRDSYCILATYSAQRRHAMAEQLVEEDKHFTIGKWFCSHDLQERRNRQFYISDEMRKFCWHYEKTLPPY